MFTIGGLSGVTHAVSPSDLQQTDTYYIVAHFHYVLFGGALLGFFAGIYYWWPKVFGYLLNEKLGKWHFWLMLIGMNLTFGPMHILGLRASRGASYTYPTGFGFDFWNLVETIGAFIIALGVLIFLFNIVHSRRVAQARPRRRRPDPWDARSLEWMMPSPTPAHNFDEIPTVTHLDEFWHRKYGEDEERPPGAHRGRPTTSCRRGDPTGVHLPSPSYWPIVLAARLPLIGYGHHLQPRPSPSSAASSCSARHLRLGARAVDATPTRPRRRTTTTPQRPTTTAATPRPSTERRRRRPSAVPRGGDQPMTDVAADRVTTPSATHTADQTRASPTRSSAMWVFLGSECLLFGGLISTYLLYNEHRRSAGPRPHELYDIPFTSVQLVRAADELAHDGARGVGDPRAATIHRCRVWLVTTALLGATFIAGQVYEFTSSTTRAWATRPTCSARPSTRSPASTAST